VFTIQTVRVGDLSVSAPFRYTTLVGSVVIGLVVFDEVPDALTVIGCAVILGAGLYAIHLERQRPVPAALRA
jgi:drug/metabolite transporter (DMT)-like permease